MKDGYRLFFSGVLMICAVFAVLFFGLRFGIAEHSERVALYNATNTPPVSYWEPITGEKVMTIIDDRYLDQYGYAFQKTNRVVTLIKVIRRKDNGTLLVYGKGLNGWSSEWVSPIVEGVK